MRRAIGAEPAEAGKVSLRDVSLMFTEKDIEALHFERFHHPHPRVRKRMEVLLLRSHGLSHPQIARLTRLSLNTVRSYVRDYVEGGVAKLKEVRAHRPQSKLMPHRAMLESYFRTYPPSSVQEAMVKIEEMTGIRRRPTQVRQLLRTLGVRISRGRAGQCNRPRWDSNSAADGTAGQPVEVQANADGVCTRTS